MDHLTVASIFDKQIQIGNTKMPVVLIPVVICLFSIIMGLNAIYLKRCNKLMSYFERFYPEIYEQIRIKPNFGILYSKGNKYKPLIDFAKDHEPLNDPKAEKMLADFIEFNRRFTWMVSAFMITGVLISFVIVVVASSR
ncbi:MAG TPA: hypothetical protein VE956_04815 [Nodularia sp. (in: cyanobacteria)]|nr:hypothetical protein [Nodularia sp. (in: cyanobacteria)]